MPRLFWGIGLLLALGGCHQSGTWVIPGGSDPKVIALFGPYWGGKAGPFRLRSAHVEPTLIRVEFVGDLHEGTVYIEKSEQLAGLLSPAPQHTPIPNGGGVTVRFACTPACTAAESDGLNLVAREIAHRYKGDLWKFTPDEHVDSPREQIDLEISAVVLVLAVLAGAWAIRRRWPGLRQRGRELLAVFVMTALAPILLSRPSVSNWYSDYLPSSGWYLAAHDHFGALGLLVQGIVRVVLPWRDTTLFALTLTFHALGACAAFLLFEALGLSRRACLIVAAVYAVLPLAVRLAWSDSQHVPATALFFMLLLAWVRVQEPGRVPELLLSLALIPAVALVRADMAAFTLMAVLFGIGWKRPVRRVLLALLFVAVWGGTTLLVRKVVLEPYRIPVPPLHDFLHDQWEAVRTFSSIKLPWQELHPGSFWSPWMPSLFVIALDIGALVALIARPALFLRVAAVAVLTQQLLNRHFDMEGLVGARYFAALLPFVALLIGLAIDLLVRLSRSRIAGGLIVVACLSLFIHAGWRLYRWSYAFQDEYSFLRSSLASIPERCRLFHVAVRDDPALRQDTDCCLDPSRSPLTIAFPNIAIEPLAAQREKTHLPDAAGGCQLYYESSICSVAPTIHTESRNPGASQVFPESCRGVLANTRLELIDEAKATSYSMWDFFNAETIPLRLYRVRSGG